MPFVLKQKETSQIFSCQLINQYELTYYGAKSWEAEPGREEWQSFLTEQNVTAINNWEIIEVTENQLKMFNVKLKNDPTNHLFFVESQPVIKKME